MVFIGPASQQARGIQLQSEGRAGARWFPDPHLRTYYFRTCTVPVVFAFPHLQDGGQGTFFLPELPVRVFT
jgi:hypothetical protein